MIFMGIQQERIRELNSVAPRENASYVLYWSQMNRRIESNHALRHAADVANENGIPLLVYEGLTFTYKGASDRMHTFLLDAVPEMAKALRSIGAGYFFYLRATNEDPDDILYRLAAKARCVVTDDYPVFIAAQHNKHVPKKVDVPFVVVDSSCIVPMNRHEKRAYGAYTIRPKIRRELPTYLKRLESVALKKAWRDELLPAELRKLRTRVTGSNIAQLVAGCSIDHSVRPSITFKGGSAAAKIHLKIFLDQRLSRYAKESNQPSCHATSDLSPYLHFGHISALEVALAVREYAAEHSLIADEFLEELIVRRELAFNFARFTPEMESLEPLPRLVQTDNGETRGRPAALYLHTEAIRTGGDTR